MFLEESFIFFPSRYPEGDWRPQGLSFEDAYFQAADGTKLHGWYVPHDSPKAVILFCHGNAGNITHRADILEELNDIGASVLIFDYRGYGRSQGKPSEKGVLADARAARAWLAKREKIPEKNVVVMGESIGGAVAVDLAAKDGAKGLVLISTFTNLPELAAYHYPIFPVRLLMRSQFDSVGLIAKYKGPLLQMHGDVDTIVPIKFGRKLFEAANEPKQFLVIHNHDHNDPLPQKFYTALKTFLEKL
ncbi:MAG TPA: alpha/beta hydrolase [Thermoguttaceae bacterium]